MIVDGPGCNPPRGSAVVGRRRALGAGLLAFGGGACSEPMGDARYPGYAGAVAAAGANGGGAKVVGDEAGGAAGSTSSQGGEVGAPSTAGAIADGADGGGADAAGTGGAEGVDLGSTLCDGSQEIRLAVVSRFGFVQPRDMFVNGYGYEALFVDGRCRYWMANQGGELRRASLTAAQVSALEAATAYDHLGDYEGEDQNCVDGDTTLIVSPDHEARCSCGCDTDAKARVLADTRAVAEELWEAAVADDFALFAARVSYLGSTNVEVTWPLSWPYTDLVEMSFFTVTGTAITSAEDRAALRAMRAEVLAVEPYAQLCSLADTSEQVSIALREELPAEVVAAIDAFLELPRP